MNKYKMKYCVVFSGRGGTRPRLSLTSVRSGWPPPRGRLRDIAPAFSSLGRDTNYCVALSGRGGTRTLKDCSIRF